MCCLTEWTWQKLEPSRKSEPQRRNCLCKSGLWVCPWGIFLMTHVDSAIPKQVVLGCIGKPRKTGKQASKQHSPMGSTSSSSLASSTRDCELEAEINPFLPKLVLVWVLSREQKANLVLRWVNVIKTLCTQLTKNENIVEQKQRNKGRRKWADKLHVFISVQLHRLGYCWRSHFSLKMGVTDGKWPSLPIPTFCCLSFLTSHFLPSEATCTRGTLPQRQWYWRSDWSQGQNGLDTRKRLRRRKGETRWIGFFLSSIIFKRPSLVCMLAKILRKDTHSRTPMNSNIPGCPSPFIKKSRDQHAITARASICFKSSLGYPDT